MNINSIKETTPVENFINIYDVEENVNTHLNNLDKVLTRLDNMLDQEVREGGLSIYALNIGGESPLIYGHSISAKKIYDDIDEVRIELNSLKKSIPLSAKKHKLDEYSMLKNKTNVFIKTLEETLEEKRRVLDQAIASKDPTAISKATAEHDAAKSNLKTWQNKIDEYDEKIKRYS